MESSHHKRFSGVLSHDFDSAQSVIFATAGLIKETARDMRIKLIDCLVKQSKVEWLLSSEYNNVDVILYDFCLCGTMKKICFCCIYKKMKKLYFFVRF